MAFRRTPESPKSSGLLEKEIKIKNSLSRICELLEKDPSLIEDPEIKTQLKSMEKEIKTQVSLDNIENLLKINPNLKEDPTIQAKIKEIKSVSIWKDFLKELEEINKEVKKIQKNIK
jgi:hypothetical protein